MKSSAVVETLEIAKHDDRGRRLADGPERQALIAGYAASGMTQDVYLSRFLLTCGVLFAGSGIAYAVSLGRAHRAGA